MSRITEAPDFAIDRWWRRVGSDTLATMTLKLLLIASCAVAACSDDTSGEIDAAVDAVDADVDAIDSSGRCGAEFFLTGEYTDWDSTTASFDGIEFSTWTVRGDTARTVMSNPNGRVELCVVPGATSTISVTQGEYVPAIYVGDPVVLQPPGQFFFQVKGIKTTRAQTFYQALGLTYDAQRAHVLVQKQGTGIPLTLSLGGTSFSADNPDDITWTAGNSGGLVLFANIDISGAQTTTLTSTSTFVGPTSLPLEAGTLTMTTIR